jgi:hypothetical protein
VRGLQRFDELVRRVQCRRGTGHDDGVGSGERVEVIRRLGAKGPPTIAPGGAQTRKSYRSRTDVGAGAPKTAVGAASSNSGVPSVTASATTCMAEIVRVHVSVARCQLAGAGSRGVIGVTVRCTMAAAATQTLTASVAPG